MKVVIAICNIEDLICSILEYQLISKFDVAIDKGGASIGSKNNQIMFQVIVIFVILNKKLTFTPNFHENYLESKISMKNRTYFCKP